MYLTSLCVYVRRKMMQMRWLNWRNGGVFFEFQPMGKSYVRCRGPTVSYLTILLTLMQVRTEL
jgi:hypothetical protein